MKIPSFILMVAIILSCTSKKVTDKRVLDSLARIDSIERFNKMRAEQLATIAREDSIATANGTRDPEAERAMMEAIHFQGDPEAQSTAFILKIVNDTIVVRRADYDALHFSFPGGQEMIAEEDIRGYGDESWTKGGSYAFRVTSGECAADDINSKIDGFDSSVTKMINGREFTIATGGIGGRDDVNFYVCYLTLDNICMSFSMQVRRSGGGLDNYQALVAQFENFIGSLKFK